MRVDAAPAVRDGCRVVLPTPSRAVTPTTRRSGQDTTALKGTTIQRDSSASPASPATTAAPTTPNLIASNWPGRATTHAATPKPTSVIRIGTAPRDGRSAPPLVSDNASMGATRPARHAGHDAPATEVATPTDTATTAMPQVSD